MHICLENEVNVNFYRHSDQDESDSVDVVEGSNQEKDQVQEDMDDEHPVYLIHSYYEKVDEDVIEFVDGEEVVVVEQVS